MLVKPMAHQLESLKFCKSRKRVADLSDAGCVSADTEFLTTKGWKRIDQYVKGDNVAQFHPDTREIEFVTPIDYIKRPCTSMIAISPYRGTSQRLSHEHRVLYYRKDGSYGVTSAREFMNICHQKTPSHFDGKFCSTFSIRTHNVLDLSDIDIRVMVAVIADGHFPNNGNRCVIRIKKQRKIERLRNLLIQANIQYKEKTCGGKPDFQVFTFDAPRHDKEFTEYWWKAAQFQLEIIADELPHWDASADKRPSAGTRFSTFIESTANFAQYAFSATKRPASITTSCRDRTNEGRGLMLEYVVHAQAKDKLIGPGRRESIFEISNPEGFKYCFEVPTSFLLLRHNGYIFATGNTGKTLVQILDFAQQHKKDSKAMLVLAPKSLLKAAWANDIRKFAPHLKVSIAWAKNRKEAFAAKADVYITNIDAVTDLLKYPKTAWKNFGRLVVDECFPAGTPIDTPFGKIPIESLKGGDLVYTSSGEQRVIKTMTRKVNALVQLELEDGTEITCSENHPIATNFGWIEARRTRGLSVLRTNFSCVSSQRSEVLQSSMCEKSSLAKKDSGRTNRNSSEMCEKTHGATELEQRCSMPPRDQSKAEHSSQIIGTQTKNSRRQRKNSAERKNDVGDASKILGIPIPNSYWSKTRQWLSFHVQAGLRIALKKMGFGSGWELSHITKALGCEERCVSGTTRVVRVSRIKCTSPCVVYNLHVDGPNTYSVGNVLVHNCTAYKNPTSKRSKAVAKLAKHFEWRRVMTGTPMPQGVCDLWHQIYILDEGKRLGASYFNFRSSCCAPVQKGPDAKHIEWQDKPGIEDAVVGLLSDIIIRHRFEDCIDIPPNHQYSVEIELNPKHEKFYRYFENMQLAEIEGKTITAINAAALNTKLLQVASGAVYNDHGSYSLIDTDRYELVADLVEARSHSTVWYQWKHQLDETIKALKTRKISYVVWNPDHHEIEQEFQAGRYQAILCHPASAGHGLTFTKAVASILCSPTYNLEHFLQLYKRIYRIGQKEKTETIVVVAPGTRDEHAWSRMLDKRVRQDDFFSAVHAVRQTVRQTKTKSVENS